jgi:hypothetical protein
MDFNYALKTSDEEKLVDATYNRKWVKKLIYSLTLIIACMQVINAQEQLQWELYHPVKKGMVTSRNTWFGSRKINRKRGVARSLFRKE